MLRYEVIGFGSLIAVYWLIEFPVVPRLILGADAHAAWDQIESVMLTTMALLVAGPLVLRTRRLVSRVCYLEQLLRQDPWSRRPDGSSTRDAIVASLGDGNLTVAWRFTPDDWVQSTLDPAIMGKVLAGRIWRSAAGSLREEYELELEGGLHLVMEGGHLRFLPLCDGRPMRFAGPGQGAQGSTILVYRCPDCNGTTQLLL